MNKNLIFTLVFFSIVFTACRESFAGDEDYILSQSIQKTRSIVPNTGNYHVDVFLVQKYIRFTAPAKTVEEITPVIRNNSDTLAYIVQYSQGWDLISGDTRMSPRLAYSETDTLNLEEYEQSGVGCITGMVDLVAEMKISSDTTVNPVWKFLLPKQQQENNEGDIIPYGDVAGMWVPIDTQYIDNGTTIPHIINTHWYQQSPYNDICKYYYMGTAGMCNSFAGCGPIALGQVIYHYLKSSNPFSVPIPINYNSEGYKIIFSNFSSTQWQNLSTANNSLSTYIIYLGQEIMGAEYIPYIDPISLKVIREVGVSSDSCAAALDWAHLQYDQTSTYNWQDIVSSLQLSHPIIVTACDSSNENGHVFIIDALKINQSKFIISYLWDDNYTPDFWGLQRNPSWLFEPCIPNNGGKDDDVYQEEITLEDNYSIAMNWGYGNSADNTYYLIRDGSRTFVPSWQANSTTYSIIDRLFINVRQ
mgnify:FL=1